MLRTGRGAAAVAGVVTTIALAITIAGCGEEKGPLATIHVGVPLTGELAERGKDMQKAVDLALEQSGYAEGGRRLKLVVTDSGQHDGTAKAAVAAANDERSLALVAGLDAATALDSSAVTRRQGLLIVAPGSGAGLDPKRYGELLPGIFEGSGVPRGWSKLPKNLIDVAPGEYVLGEATAQAAAASDARRIDWSARDMPKAALQGMSDAAERMGIKVAENEQGICPDDKAARARGLEPAGEVRITPAIKCPDNVLVIDDATGAIDPQQKYGRTLITPSLAYKDLPPAGKRFYDDFHERYGHWPDRWAIFAYEAAGLALQAIKDANDDFSAVTRASVRDAAFKIRDRFGPVGHYDVLPDGRTTLYTVAARKLPLPEDAIADRPPGGDRVIEVTR